ncbi:MAG: hypothetical protein ACC662_01455 [Planctomycetota bacterium]
MNRRQLLRLLTAAGAVLLVRTWPALERVLPRRQVEAIRSRVFPGRVHPLDPERLRRPAPWAG